VCDPFAAARAHDGLECGDQAARRDLQGDRAVDAVVDVGLTVGDGDHLGAGQALLQQPMQRLRRPLDLQPVALGTIVPELPE
jgi:hypothetical protein